MIASYVQIRKNAQQNPKEKSRINANLKLMKSKKFITPNEGRKFILKDVQKMKATLELYWSLKTSEE